MNRSVLLAASFLLGCASEPPVAGAILFEGGTLPGAEGESFVQEISERPELSAQQEAVIQQIVDGPEGFFDRAPPAEVLNETELVFFAAGRIFELLDFYADAVDRGVEALRPRKAWLLERGGLHDAALAEARIAVQRAPESADAHFVLGYVLGQSDEADTALLREIRDAYRATVTLDPDYVGPSDVQVNDVLEQVRALDAALQ